MMRQNDARPTLLLVDDEPVNLQLLRHTLQDDYRLLFARDGNKALALARTGQPDLILLDIMMPGMSGYEVCQTLKQSAATADIPVIFVTALAEAANEQHGFDLGAVDYITKPFSPAIVKVRVRNQLSLVQADVLRRTRLQIVQCLGMAAEYKDNETGLHVVRMSHYARVLALAAGYSPSAAEELLHAAPMHDVGKIGIPDAILQKPGKLTDAEWQIMRQHTVIGARIIGEHDSGLLRMAAIIALNHHEKWDGSGYPQGLRGENIPHVARIVAIADVFDALTSVRPYKQAWPVEKALALIRDESGRHFDPELAALLPGCMDDILRIKQQWAEHEPARTPASVLLV
ncbi:putative two-component system response regulator [Microvirgula sp. AG722]|uniref:Two-component system response regulator n=1 Tax=Microvirgula aerodenitrificans TaxID=57480 RepID=A0A2U3TGX4_9NEIS|nr:MULTISPECIES: HD domain-containing phosphohydrolase [Microvirgula]AVY92644.1 two-component system response regulator [Microvirgula aerodenitrificans]RAS13363.1 putative two-component system response regulator [Microvirgula sp. AG722]